MVNMSDKELMNEHEKFILEQIRNMRKEKK